MQRGILLLASTLTALAVSGIVASVSSAKAPPHRCEVEDARTHIKYTTLQEAVGAASANDTLTINGTCMGDTTIEQDLNIVGRGSATLDGSNSAKTPGSVVSIVSGATATISGLTIKGGDSSLSGGGIDSKGSLTLVNSTVEGNQAAKIGGGIYAIVLTLEHATVRGNSATAEFDEGGGVFALESLTLKNSRVADNEATQAGGIFIHTGTLTLENSSVDHNSAVHRVGFPRGAVGGIRAVSYGGGSVTATLKNSSVSYNTADEEIGGMDIGGSLTLERSTVEDNRAGEYIGGISVVPAFGASSAALTLRNSTVKGNEAQELGGGIYSDDAFLTLEGSDVSDNVVTNADGGGIYNQGGSVSLEKSTINDNKARDGGGIYSVGRPSFLASVELNGSSSVRGNEASGQGGGIYNGPHSSLTLNGSGSVRDNGAEDGGGIFNEDSVTLNGEASMTRNTASKDGGGIYNEAGSVTFNGSSSLTRNEASTPGSGGGIFNHKTGGAAIIFGVGSLGTVSRNEPENIEEV